MTIPCPMCRTPMVEVADSPNRKSRDHILPRCRGGTASLPEGVRNVRIICQDCNSQIARSCHCVALLACVRAVADDRGASSQAVLQYWRIGAVSQRLAEQEGWHVKRPVEYRDPSRVTLAAVWPA